MEIDNVFIPPEMIHEIFEKTSFRQRRAVSRTCKLFYFLEASFYPSPKDHISLINTIHLNRKAKHTNFRCGMSIDQRNGNIFVANTTNNRVEKFDQNGNLLNFIGSTGAYKYNERLRNPRGLCVNQRNGNIVVADTNNHRIVIYDNNGNYIKSLTSFKYPWNVCVDERNNNIVVVDIEDRVRVLSPDNVTEKEFVFESRKFDIDQSTGNIITGKKFLSDTIKIKDENGQQVKDLTNNPNELYNINGVCIDQRNGNIIVIDSVTKIQSLVKDYNNRLFVYDKDGQLLMHFSDSNWSILPCEVCMDQETGNILVLDTCNNNIQVLSYYH